MARSKWTVSSREALRPQTALVVPSYSNSRHGSTLRVSSQLPPTPSAEARERKLPWLCRTTNKQRRAALNKAPCGTIHRHRTERCVTSKPHSFPPAPLSHSLTLSLSFSFSLLLISFLFSSQQLSVSILLTTINERGGWTILKTEEITASSIYFQHPNPPARLPIKCKM